MAKGAYIGVGGVARKIKKGYVGIDTDIPIYGEPTTTTVTADKMTEFFDIANGSYYFAHEGTSAGTFASNNGGVDSSTAETILTAKMDMDVSFYYSYASEEDFDKFYLTFAGTSVENGASGQKVTKQYSGSLKAGEAIKFTYKKDKSASSEGDRCAFSGIVVTAAEFIGYETKSLARKIKKAYIGIGGVARPCWGVGELKYYGQITNLAEGDYASGAVAGDYIVISTNKSVTAYNKSFTRTTAAGLEAYDMQGCTLNGDYAVFLGGLLYATGQNKTTCYDRSLTKIIPFTMTHELASVGVVNFNNCLLYGGGHYDGESPRLWTIKVDPSFTQTSLPDLTNFAHFCSAATNGEQAYFTCGYNSWNGNKYNTVDRYDKSFTKSAAPELRACSAYMIGVSHGKYAMFCGNPNYVDYYDTSGSKHIADSMMQNRDNTAAGFHMGDSALITGSQRVSSIDVYDEKMVHTVPFDSITFGENNGNCPAGVGNEDVGIIAGGASSNQAYGFIY